MNIPLRDKMTNFVDAVGDKNERMRYILYQVEEEEDEEEKQIK